MLINRMYRLRERGDTIVEVLIAIAVISLVLGGAYVTTNRSLLATRAAQERAIALKLTESQVEQLKSIAKTDPDEIFGSATPNPFCIADMAAADASSADCQVDSAGEPTATEPVFHLAVTRASDGNTFTVVNQWEDPSGGQTDEVRMIYRVYE